MNVASRAAARAPHGSPSGTETLAPFHLGRISYINVLPIYYYLDTVWKEQPGGVPFPLEVTSATPSELNAMLASGALGLSPVSSIELARHPDRYLIADGLSIQSLGPVQSVLLVSKVEIDDLDDCTIACTVASATSRVLLNVLLSQVIGVKAHYVDLEPGDPLKDHDAALLIGDAALQYQAPSDGFVYDLGQLWYKETRSPMVFAVWAARSDASDEELEQCRLVARALQRSLEVARGHLGPVMREAASLVCGSERAAAAYFRHLRYDLDGVAQDGLKLFFQCAERAGDIPKVPRLEFLGR